MMRWITIYFVLVSFGLAESKRLDSSTEITKQCAWRQSTSDDNENRYLSCLIKTISGLDGLIGNLTAISDDDQVISSLRLECSDVLVAENALTLNTVDSRNRDLSAFNEQLHELVIQQCKIKSVPSATFESLRNLKSLTLQTHNADWSTNNLELHPNTFSGLNELKQLNIADNNIWILPNGVFCPLSSLRYLNLSNNHINDISQVGFSENEEKYYPGMPQMTRACNTGLEELDLSHNHIIGIPNNCFSALSSLNFLHLDSNQLTILDDDSFKGIERLQVLDISNNRLIALPPELFDNTKELKRLYFRNNSLAVLAPGIFEKLNQLQILDLSHNELTSSWINRDTFVGLSALVMLKLNNNKLKKIDQFVFRELFEMQVLNLEVNNIEQISQNAFTDLRNLRQLLVSNNNLKIVDSRNFAGLPSLNQLILESNEISTIHHDAFDNLLNLVDLSLNDNKLNMIPGAIKKLRNMQALDLGKNQIDRIDSDAFDGLEQLTGLRLTDNQIETISKGAFENIKSIHVLNLASNKIRHIDQSAFSSNEKLRAIRLDCNSLEDISSVFTSLSSLVLLNVSNNNIKWFDFSHLPQSLEWLDIHNNSITELGNYFDVTSQLRINYLDVSNNKIRKIKSDLIPKNITTINLSRNLIDDIPSGTFLNKKKIRKIYLIGNMIKKLQITSLIVTKFDVSREAPEVYMAGNPLHCDCHSEWLRNINDLSEQRRQLPKLMDMKKIKCTMEHDHEQQTRDEEVTKALFELNSNDFLCKYENHCHSLCQCCQDGDDAADCKCKMVCPDQCSCYHDNTWNQNIVDCGNANLKTLPPKIPIDVTTLYMDGNNLTHLTHHHFVGKNRLESLYLNGSRIHSIANNTFDELRNMRILHLNNNHLTKLSGHEFKELSLLTELYLDHNHLTHINEHTFKHLRFLRTIDLSYNKLIDFNPINQLSASSNTGVLSQVYLDGDNSWNCDCKSLVQLIEWIKHRTNNFNVNRMLCMDGRIVGDVLNKCQLSAYDTKHQVVTPSSSLNPLHHQQSTMIFGLNHQSSSDGSGYIPLIAAVVLTAITSGLLVALVCIFRQDIKLWAYSKYGVRLFDDGKKNLANRCNHPNEHTNDDQCYGAKLYDAYFLYSINDTDLLGQILLPELQSIGYSLSLFNHNYEKPAMSRDNYQITDYLTDAMKMGAETSHKMVLVVSFNFLQNEWCDPIFRCALQTVIESMHRNKTKMVLILTVPVQLLQMDPILQHLIPTSQIVMWGEKRFWMKLRYALPDVSSASPTSNQPPRSNGFALNNYSSPYVCNSYAVPINPYYHQTQPQYHHGTTNEMPNTCRRSVSQLDFDQMEYRPHQSRGGQSIGGSSLNHVYSTIPETPPLSSSSNASSSQSVQNIGV